MDPDRTTSANKAATVVIGAGVIGLVTACRLQQQGQQVLLLDANGVGAGCSFGNAGHLATEQVFPLADAALLPKLPGFLLDPLGPLAIRPRYFWRALPFFYRFLRQMFKAPRERNTAALKVLLQDAIPAWQRLAKDANCGDLLRYQGSLLVFEQSTLSQQDQVAQVEQVAQSYRAKGVALEILTQKQLQQQYPGLSGAIQYAILFTEVGHTLSPSLINQRLLQWFLAMGGRFEQQKVLAIESSEASALQLRLTTKKITANTVVLCTGAYSKELLKPLGYRLPLEAERGYHLMTSPPSMPAIPVASFDRKMIMTPMQHGLRLAGTVEFAGLNASDNWQRAKLLRHHGEALWPELAGSISQVGPEACWSGLRPTLADSLPVISQSHLPGLWLHFGHQHLGLTLAAVSTELLIQMMQGDATAVEKAQPYRVSRFE
ncbi:FAD-dependent oxidoreductase [Rheinheimera riviphila]|uniref:FAD-dependent oxidoreductase n=1 Tax=Rheinheimera riviphila TaxID=1834037 RepID=A0A437QRN5_9GAMM|nr:FAD-dependent oxidoreductase [Rheinheimera riviphila]RVU37152.1 FAD-dependent oxidoreductase [Rheinheimera riviphila]